MEGRAGGHPVTTAPPPAPNQCDLNCLAEGQAFYHSFGRVLDGTPCSPGAPELCVAGRCLVRTGRPGCTKTPRCCRSVQPLRPRPPQGPAPPPARHRPWYPGPALPARVTPPVSGTRPPPTSATPLPPGSRLPGHTHLPPGQRPYNPGHAHRQLLS